MRSTSRSLAAVSVLACAIVLSACGTTNTAPVSVADSDGVTLQRIPGTTLERITLSASAAYRIGIETAPVARAGKKLERIPYAAVMYTPTGNTYTYTSPHRLSFVRAAISIARLAGGVAYLRNGPAVGTQVVTVGSDELLGTEEGVQDEGGRLRSAPPETSSAARRHRG